MALETTVYDELKKKLGDSTVKVKVNVNGVDEEKGLVDYIAYIEEGVEKTKAANKDLTQQRENWEKQEKEYKKTVADITAIKTELEKKVEESTGKSSKSKEEKAEWERQLNAVNEKLKEMEEKNKAAENRVKESEERAKQANEKASKEGLSKDLLTELAENKIVGTQADFAVNVILSKGFAKLIPDSETGLYRRSFATFKDGKELAADVKTLCKWFADTNQFLVSSSGKPGTGTQHSSGQQPPTGSGKRNYFSMIQTQK